MIAHASLGASNAHRWLECAGSVQAEIGLPNTSSVFALEGTTAHDLAELTLTTTDGALDLFADQEMADYVRIYTDYVRSLSDTADLVLIEGRLFGLGSQRFWDCRRHRLERRYTKCSRP